MRLARAAGDSWVTAFALCTVGDSALWQRDHTAAATALHESLALFQQVGERWGAAIALEALGHLAVAEHELGAAAGRFAQSLLIRQDLGDRPGIAASLEGLAGLAARRGQRERALVLAGAAEQLRETTGAPLSPMGRQRLDHWLVPLRQAVGEQGVAGARAQSRTLGVEQAMALALASADVAPPASADGQHRPEEQASVLTRRERQVAALVGRGLSNRQIATELVITERTAGSHIEHILDKLNPGSRTQVGVWASQQGLLGPGSA